MTEETPHTATPQEHAPPGDDVTLAELGPRATAATLELRAIRQQLGLTQPQMAEALGLKDYNYARQEQGNTSVPGPTLLLARVLLGEAQRVQRRRRTPLEETPRPTGRQGPQGPLPEAVRAKQRAAQKKRRRQEQQTHEEKGV